MSPTRVAIDGDPRALPLTSLAGIGPARAARLSRLGLRTLGDLFFFSPRRLEQRGERCDLATASGAVGAKVCVRGRPRRARLARYGYRRSRLAFELEDETGKLAVAYFNQPWLYEKVRAWVDEGVEVELYGRIQAGRSGAFLAAPRVESEGMRAAQEAPAPGTLEPIYPLTEGIALGFLRRLIQGAVETHADALVESLAPAELRRLGVPALSEAVGQLHAPTDEALFLQAQRRLALERILALQARLLSGREERGAARRIRLPARERAALLAQLPHRPTAGQERVIGEIVADLGDPTPMRRLLQGDVGSGKTLVALAALAAVARSGGQAALLAPTEVLAQQHYFELAPWLASLGIRASYLAGSQTARERRQALADVARARSSVVCGTHALLSEGVLFDDLAFCVIDEQQRFGVAQKRILLEKGRDVHLLLMTATPIPRTLALCLFGDLALSILDEAPPGRGFLATHLVEEERRGRALAFLDERLARGERAFWICPRIEGDGADADGPAAAEEAYAGLSASRLGRHGVELLHGRMPAKERAQRIQRFRDGAVRLLVGTSIVEVGVDVPEATCMVIESPERFGLSQLHQLRGRVGRGAQPSHCLLLVQGELSERLRVLEECSDGFQLAEEDLRRRGMGDLAGLRQAGENVEGLAEAAVDAELIEFARAKVREDAELAARYAGEGWDGGADLV